MVTQEWREEVYGDTGVRAYKRRRYELFGGICDGCNVLVGEHRCHSWGLGGHKTQDVIVVGGERMKEECQCNECKRLERQESN